MTVFGTAVSMTGKMLCALLLSFGLFSSPAFGDSWARAYGSTDYEQASAVEQTADGGYIIAGVTWSFGAGNDDAWIVKTDQNGTVQWQKAFGGSDFDEFRAIQQTADGGFITAGVTGSFGAGSGDAWVIKLDAAGSVQWQKTFGGSGYDEAHSIRKTADGGYVIAGKTSSFGAGGEDAWVLKLAGDGTVQWQKAVGGGLADSAKSIRETSDGGFVTAGVTWSSGAGGEALIVKLDSGGTVQWQKTYGGSGYDEFNSIQQAGDGGLIAAGMTGSFGAGNGDLWVVRFDATGNVLWQKTYGGSLAEWSNAVYPASDSGFVVAGSTWSSGATFYDAWVLKLDSSGAVSSCAAGFSGASSLETAGSAGTLNSASLTVSATAVSGQILAASATGTSAVAGDACTYVEPNISVTPAEIDFGPVSIATSAQGCNNGLQPRNNQPRHLRCGHYG